MALGVHLDVNGSGIGDLEIQRVFTSQNGSHKYTVTSFVDGERREAHFVHNEGDGAFACVRRALEALEATHGLDTDALPVQFRRSDRIN